MRISYPESQLCGTDPAYGATTLRHLVETESMTDPPKPPTGLRAPGRKLWNSVVGPYVLTAGELAVLEQACRAADLCERLERDVRALPELISVGYAGQPRPHTHCSLRYAASSSCSSASSADSTSPTTTPKPGDRQAAGMPAKQHKPAGDERKKLIIMAKHRKPPSTPTPVELTEFAAAEWAAPGEAEWQWQQGFKRW
jgi:hypothetical protein